MARAVWNGAAIAESNDVVVLEGNAYFPRETLRDDLVEPSPHHSTCGWKGEASYLDVVVDGERNKDAVWYYPTRHQLPGRSATGSRSGGA